MESSSSINQSIIYAWHPHKYHKHKLCAYIVSYHVYPHLRLILYSCIFLLSFLASSFSCHAAIITLQQETIICSTIQLSTLFNKQTNRNALRYIYVDDIEIFVSYRIPLDITSRSFVSYPLDVSFCIISPKIFVLYRIHLTYTHESLRSVSRLLFSLK